MHLQELASLRQMAYRLLSSMLVYPTETRLKSLAAATTELHKESRSMVRFAFFPQWRRLLASLAELPERHALEQQYVRVFMHNSEAVPSLPYESVYLDPGGQAAGWTIALLEQEYAAAGLALSPSLKDLPDHVAVELEFMAFMCGQEADAWNRETVADAVEALKREATFLDTHLTRWLSRWARQVAAADSKGVYSVVAETTSAFVSHDRDLTGSLLDRLWRTMEAARPAGTAR